MKNGKKTQNRKCPALFLGHKSVDALWIFHNDEGGGGGVEIEVNAAHLVTLVPLAPL